MATSSTRSSTDRRLAGVLARAVAPILPGAFGVAVGIVSGGLVLLVTFLHLVVLPDDARHIELLAQYFPGYRVSAGGAMIGAIWGFAVGFAAGWLLAFVRNLSMRLLLGLARARTVLAEEEFLDRI